MPKLHHTPFLHFNFATADGKRKPVLFSSPVKTLIAWKIDEVIPCLEEVQLAVKDGYYAAGYMSYEAAPAFHDQLQVKNNHMMPLFWFGIFNEPIFEPIEGKQSFTTGDWEPTVTIDGYHQSIDQIHHYIKQGKTEQVNYTIKMESQFEGDAISFYKQLEQAQAANYTAFLDIGDFTILSASPELFFNINEGKITTKPMKGTVARGKTYQQDIENAKWLQNSQKNRNENELVVKLMQNELATIAKKDTVKVPKRYEVEKYPTVYQMTSTVTAELLADISIVDVFRAMFPCGSITGLPKANTMDIIAELEQAPREVYCGTIGYLTPKQEAIFNVPIRTVIVDNHNGKASYGVGGGITLESTKKEEYEELLAKAEVLRALRPTFQLLETLGLFNGSYFVFDEHLKRLSQSVRYFDFDLDLDTIKVALLDIAKENPVGHFKIRLLVSPNGEYMLEAIKMNIDYPDVIYVGISDEPIDKENPFLYHKTTNRKMYEEHRQKQSDVFDVLLWNNNNEITEFTGGNIVVELNGELVTPSVESGLLAGTFRASLLNDGIITERLIKVDQLAQCTKIWFINSVRKWIPVKIKEK